MKIRDVAILGFAVLVVQLLLTNFLYPNLAHATVTHLFAIQPATGIGGQVVGNTILSYIAGVIPFSLGGFSSWIAMYIGVFLLVWAGLFIYEQHFAWKGKNQFQRLFAILLYGHAILYAILWYLLGNVPGIGFSLLLGLGINLLLVAGLLGLSVKLFNFPRY